MVHLRAFVGRVMNLQLLQKVCNFFNHLCKDLVPWRHAGTQFQNVRLNIMVYQDKSIRHIWSVSRLTRVHVNYDNSIKSSLRTKFDSNLHCPFSSLQFPSSFLRIWPENLILFRINFRKLWQWLWLFRPRVEFKSKIPNFEWSKTARTVTTN
jgi:hypothetical protein